MVMIVIVIVTMTIITIINCGIDLGVIVIAAIDNAISIQQQ